VTPRVRRARGASLALAALLAAGCGSISGTYPRDTPLVPAASLQITEGYTLSLEKMVQAGLVLGLAYYVVDPLAPSWDIREAQLGEDRFALSLRMKRFHAGGNGEARVIFNRRAEQLRQERGYAGYQILGYNEGMESSLPVPLGQRVSEGVIRLVRAAP
jgi:hypothetical protein